MLGRKELIELLKWAKEQKDKKGVSLLDRAKRVVEEEGWKKYGTEVTYERWRKGNVFDKIGWVCSCPQATYGKPCKHFLAVILIDHKDLLSLSSPKWKEFFDRALAKC